MAPTRVTGYDLPKNFHPGLPPDEGPVVAVPEVGGSHHHNGRLAALRVRVERLAMSAWVGFRERQAHPGIFLTSENIPC
jgi:hypothetical protein